MRILMQAVSSAWHAVAVLLLYARRRIRLKRIAKRVLLRRGGRTRKEARNCVFRPLGAASGSRQEADMNPEQQEQLRVHIRWMIRRDMAEVLQIENEGFEFSWNEEDFIRCLRQRNCIGMVAEHDDRVVGFMIYELHRTRLHLLNFAVARDFRRRRGGTQMLAKLLAKLSSQRRTRIMLEVRETNLPAQLFFRNMGFRAVSVLRDFYDDTTEDAYLMQYRYRPVEAEVILPINRITKLAG
jgi:ribosomal-protein-alanine N-acetyltransferase